MTIIYQTLIGIKVKHRTQITNWFSTMASFQSRQLLSQMIKKPTHKASNILNLVFTNNKQLFNEINCITTTKSDHSSLKSLPTSSHTSQKPSKTTKYSSIYLIQPTTLVKMSTGMPSNQSFKIIAELSQLESCRKAGPSNRFMWKNLVQPMPQQKSQARQRSDLSQETEKSSCKGGEK